MWSNMKRFLYLFLFALFVASPILAHQPVIVGKATEEIRDPAISRAFYDALAGQPRSYFINTDKAFDLYLNLLVPKNTNASGHYSARVYRLLDGRRQLLVDLKASSVEWREFYEPFGGDTYLKGPEFKRNVPAGRYAIEVYSAGNRGKYVLAVGEKEFFGPKEIAQVYVAVPRLKGSFFGTSPFQFLITPFGIVLVVILVFAAVLGYFPDFRNGTP
jgi:hypothetical protein